MTNSKIPTQELAIIVPAFRSRYLKDSLESILKQTNQDFNLYVFDDASNEPIKQIVNKFQVDRPVTYHRFAENLGGRSLVKHWSRCLALTQEPWVWLFSDDDVMEPDCVASFYRTLEATHAGFDVYRFNTSVIDESSHLLRLNPPHPEQESWMEFAYFLMRGLRSSIAQEIIFSRASYERDGGWIDFPLAWASDHASQLAWAFPKGLKLIDNAHVRWRWSGQNISSVRERKLKMVKARASMEYITWFLKRVQATPDPSFQLPAGVFNLLTRDYFIGSLTHERQVFNLSESLRISRFMSQTWGGSKFSNLCRMLKISLKAIFSQGRNYVASNSHKK